MKRLSAALLVTLALSSSACTTAVVVRPPQPRLVLVEGKWVKAPHARAVWVPAHWHRRGLHKVWVAGHWR